MASLSDLCSLDDVKSWLALTNTQSDALLPGLITASSRNILEYLNRSFILPALRTEVRDGTGSRKMMLKEWPVLAVQSLTVDGAAILPCTDPPFGSGYILEAADAYPPGHMQRLTLTSRVFASGLSNVTVAYTAGYQVTGEAWAVPADPFKVTVATPFGSWGSDQGVTYANGTALVKVSANPTAGQYSVAGGVYTFAEADLGAAVLISYGYVPAEIRQACIEAVGERFKVRDRIGVQSKTLAGQETITYSASDLPAAVKLMLNSFMAVTPI